MALDILGHVLEELSSLMNTKLQANQYSSCMFKFEDAYVQVEIDKAGEHLLIVSKLGTIPAGKYRETLFREALRHNGFYKPFMGIFAYSKHADMLILYEMLPVKDINGNKVFSLLPDFCSKVKIWTEAIARGEMPQVGNLSNQGMTGGLFGMSR